MSASCTNLALPFHCTTTDNNVKQIQNPIQLKIVPNPKFTNNSMPFQAICFRKPPPRFSSMETRASPTPSMPKTVGGDSEEVLPPVLDSSSDPPPLFDGTTRLYTSYICPYAQRVWIARNYKGLQEKIRLVPIDLQNRPDWYKEKVYPPNKVPSLEHNNEIRGESLDLLKYIDSYFEGPALYPDDPTKREFAEELLSYTNTFNLAVITSLKGGSENEISTAFDYLESALFKFTDGPFFLGQFSLVDIAYAPFIERFYPLLLDVKKYDITTGRPMLTSWIEEMNKIEAYKQTKRDLQELIAVLKKRFSIN